MSAGLDVTTVRFGRPEYLWLLVAPGLLVLVWLWQLARRRQDASRLKRRRVPIHERFSMFGGLLFWLGLTLATACVIVALARPEATVSVVRGAGADIVVLQDGSASMHVEDVRGNRWRRSMAFLRVLGESLRWKDDRLAMAAFAHIAAPQFRLTRDPNTFLFFLDHLEHESPFRLEDDTTWDTNFELGLAWGLRLIDKDEELHGRSPNARILVLISDGQAWSGAVARPLRVSRARNIPLFVVGVGTTTGGIIPPPMPARSIPGLPPPPPASPYVPIRSSLDRTSLAAIATAGGGEYFELDRESDREIANRVIEVARQRSGPRGLEDRADELYWRCLMGAAALVSLGSLTLRERGELWIQLTGIAATIVAVWMLVRFRP
jgi:hypothetical protein